MCEYNGLNYHKLAEVLDYAANDFYTAWEEDTEAAASAFTNEQANRA